jgi:serine/threonine-protein kinase
MDDTVLAPEFIALQRALAGRYSLERELGRGGMGIVFLARDVALDRPVAIKLLPPAQAERPGLRERFLREAKTAAKLSQPNIVPIHAVEEAAGLVFFVMSYVEGETLGERLRARGPLTPHDTARMLQEVAWALGYAHGRGVVHRDIKPDNVMLERGTGRAVVMDFGIAALAADVAGGEVLGTAQYISPEQANGEVVDGRSDLYSLGVVAYLALTGRLPFSHEDPSALIAMHITKPAPPVASVMPGVPRRLAQAVDRCLAKAPAARFPDGEALAESVAQALEPKRQLPVPVRLWLSKGQESRLAYFVWYTLAGPGFGWVAGFGGSMLLGPLAGWMLGITAYVFTPLAIQTIHRLWRLRVLLSEGYAVADARLAVRDLVERRREEVSYEYGHEPPLWAKVCRKLMIASGATFVGVSGMVILGAQPTLAATIAAAASAGLWLTTSALQTTWPGQRVTSDRAAEWRLKFWNSRFARWFERIARLGLRHRAAPAELTFRPTEMAIGLAADALFESLSKEQRKELRELPQLIERLQHDAQLLRKTVDDLNGALAGLGDSGAAAQSSALRAEPATGADGRLLEAGERLRADLAGRRDQAGSQLASAVAALEGIRLNLLRLKAGTGSVAELTADLAAARDAIDGLVLAAAAREEVEALLGGARVLTGELHLSGPQHA